MWRTTKARIEHILHSGWFAAIVGALLAFCALNVYILLDNARRPALATQAVDYYSFGGTGEHFDRAGDNLAAVSASGGALLTPLGEIAVSDTFSFSRPAVSGGAVLSLFYDVGAGDCVILRNDGDSCLLSLAEPVLAGDVNDSGFFALALGSGEDYRVQVFDNLYEPVFTYGCSTGNYPVGVCLLNSSRVAVHCLTSSGSTIRVFSLNSGKEEWSFIYEKGILLDMEFLENGSLALIAEEEALVLNRKGALENRFSYGRVLLSDYCFSDGCFFLLLNKNRFGREGTLCRIDSTGECEEKLPVSRGVKSLSATGSSLLVLYSDELTLYRNGIEDGISYQHTDNASAALLYKDSAVFLADRYGATRIEFP